MMTAGDNTGALAHPFAHHLDGRFDRIQASDRGEFLMTSTLPASIDSEEQLEELLSEPSEAVIAAIGKISGDVMLLGAAGKMGLSLARMLKRATDERGEARRIVAVSRFSQPGHANCFEQYGIEVLAGDLLRESFVDRLPVLPNIVFMTGMKFGTGSQAAQTWAMNAYLPALVCRHFRASRFLSFSTGNVYPFVPVAGHGSIETDRPDPVGEYGMSALGRERIFEYFSLRDNLPVSIVRLNYAVEMRYGVLVDLARQVHRGEPIDLTMGYANVIWQGDANAHALCALADATSPPLILNVAGTERLNVQQVCEQFGERFGRPVRFVNQPAENALLSNSEQACRRYGLPRIRLDQLIDWTAQWIEHGGSTWDKPTHFQSRDGRY
jgi:nucleoside-diphosphate-sugar epimerase